MKKISIIGLGEVGAELASLLLSISELSINLIDPANIHGRFLDLAHTIGITNNHCLINDFEFLNQSEIVIYTAGYSNKQGESRNSVAKHNRKLIQQVFSKYLPKQNTTIISITNPVELSAQWIKETCAQHRHLIQVFGTGTSLDTYRLKYILKSNFPQIDKIDIEVIGEHGDNMIPAWSKCTFDNENISNLSLDMELTKIKEELTQSAFTIRKTEKATKFGIAHTTFQIIKHLLNSTQAKIPLSTEINNSLKEILGLRNNIFLSLSCNISNGSIQPIYELDIDKNEWSDLKTAAHHIENVYFETK